MRAYHIDTSGLLTKKIKNHRIHKIEPQRIPYDWENRSSLVSRYPDGLSQWGLQILGIQYNFDTRALNLSSKDNDGAHRWDSYLIDVLYEYERLVKFPEKNSRFQSIFALESIEEAKEWTNFFGQHKNYLRN